MSLETRIEELTEAVTTLTKTMEAVMAGAVAVDPKPDTTPEPETKKPAAKKPAATKKPAAKNEPAPEPDEAPDETTGDEPAVTLDQLKAKFAELGKAKGGKAVKAILTDFGFDGFSKVPADDPQIDAMFRTAQEQLEG